MRRNLLKARESAGLTQAALARAVEVSQSTIARVENGESVPLADLGLRLQAVLGVPLAELLEQDSDDAPTDAPEAT